ncbi:ABC transporter ATP-binding protein [Deinococcus metallilatus]|uniref:ABC transporter ATP-binding protein n=1 Tax=Deinococcus metallilatus TaxID=1211322 RepID=A0AAJ5K5Z4_9DEIO|nr:ABC transporter ATP-binding protein [Deinococcus metallilatus]MBB5294505.1 ABC-2 type transport system ATP-binding protein [Deinococcus metallilatus]QBY07555.1 ABC transporter ATP-binding protein [Deinococcus metallilatus]RXJ13971.1 ABC transporter ATP-binding protein [Deinococcus metallilatus]TLK29936.1 ABC transporter ATP-binding protein [Deinococcus metallilatus]GMA15720.1 multidrug ABC transporter ATP-binding protein [Deinococcus metallilatus]
MTAEVRPLARPEGADAPPVIEVQGVRYAYGDIEALRGIDLTVPRGTFFALLGPNGAGKSTLVGLLSTLLPLQTGAARVAGFDVRRQSAQVRRELGLVFQEPSLDERLTVLENLDFHGRIYGLPARERARRAAHVLDVVELADWQNATARILSRGMKRRLEIARGVMHGPALLMLDEPTTGLDVQSRRAVWTYLGQLRRETGVSLLLTTHQIEEAEGADLVAILDRGEVLAFGPPAELRERHGGTVVTLRGPGPALRARLERQYTGQVEGAGDELRLRVPDAGALLADLAPELGSLRGLSVQTPSLEDVFLDLTGRALREDRPGPHEATLAFARGGGEHTR